MRRKNRKKIIRRLGQSKHFIPSEKVNLWSLDNIKKSFSSIHENWIRVIMPTTEIDKVLFVKPEDISKAINNIDRFVTHSPEGSSEMDLNNITIKLDERAINTVFERITK